MRRVAPCILTLGLDSAVLCPGIAPGASAPIGAPALTVQNASRSLDDVSGISRARRSEQSSTFDNVSSVAFPDEATRSAKVVDAAQVRLVGLAANVSPTLPIRPVGAGENVTGFLHAPSRPCIPLVGG